MTSPGCARAKPKAISTAPGSGRSASRRTPVARTTTLILWLPSLGAIVSGDSLSDFGEGLGIQLGGRKHVTREDVAQRLRPLLELPIELVLPAHGEPTDRAALERALG